MRDVVNATLRNAEFFYGGEKGRAGKGGAMRDTVNTIFRQLVSCKFGSVRENTHAHI